jgi:LEA14-like dessication related protein
MVDRGAALRVGAVVLVLAVLVGGVSVFSFAQNFREPELRSMESSFGGVTEETTTIRSDIVVRNPNDRSLPGGATVSYTVSMNDLTVGEGRKRGVAIEPGRNEIQLKTKLNNSKIPDWWVTHVNNGERTTLRTRPRVTVAGVVDRRLPAQDQPLETNLLASFEGQEDGTVALANSSVLEVRNQRAEWGTADAERTPILVRTDLHNVHDRPVQFDGTEYRIEMNGIVVGDGTTDDAIHLEPGESGTFTARPAIRTPRMQQWWASHVRNDETTRLSVVVYGVVESDGERKRVPLSIFHHESRIDTRMLDGGETTDELREVDDDGSFASPELVDRESEYGEITDAETEILTRATIDNPNEGDGGDVVTLDLQQRTEINGVESAAGAGTLSGLDPGNNTVTVSSIMDHDAVPHWWAGHVNGGEESTVVTTTNATADVGVTTVPVDVPDEESGLQTDLLAEFNSDENQPVEREGETVMVVRKTRAEWGTTTADRAPIETAVTVENRQPRSITIRDITYTVELNDVALADNRTADDSYAVGPYATRTIDPTFELDNRKMADWWPTHARNGEESTMTTTVYVTVETPTGTVTTELDSFGGNQTVSTSVIAD